MTEPTKKEIDAHIASLEAEAVKNIRPKYLKGQKEHGGKLWKKNIVPLLDEEFTDIKAYWPTLKKQIETLVAAADKALRGEGIEDLHDALAPFHFQSEKGND